MSQTKNYQIEYNRNYYVSECRFIFILGEEKASFSSSSWDFFAAKLSLGSEREKERKGEKRQLVPFSETQKQTSSAQTDRD